MKYFLLIVLLSISSFAFAKNGLYILVTKHSTYNYQPLARELQRVFAASKSLNNINGFEIINVNKYTEMEFEKSDIVIVLNEHDSQNNQLQRINYSTAKVVVLTILTPESAISNENRHGFSSNEFVLSLRPPIIEMLKVALTIPQSGAKKNVVIPVSKKLYEEIQPQLGILNTLDHIKLKIIDEGQIAAKVVEPDLFNASAMIAVYDKAIWQGSSAKSLLYAAYSYKVPVVAYSEAFLKAGAAYAVHTDVRLIADRIINYALDDNQIKYNHSHIIYPSFRVNNNPAILKNLGLKPIQLMHESTLLQVEGR